MAQAERFGGFLRNLGRGVGNVLIDEGANALRDLLPEEKAQVQRFRNVFRNIGRNVGREVVNVGRDAARDLGNRLIDNGADALRDLLPEERAQVQRFRNVLRNIGRNVGREVVNVGRDAARDLGGRLIDRGADALRDLLPQAQLQQFSDEDIVEMLNLVDLFDQDRAEVQLGSKIRG